MARIHSFALSFLVLLALFSAQLAVSADPPSPAPQPSAALHSSPPSQAEGPVSPSPSPELSPPPADLAPGSSPSPSEKSPSPAPSPSEKSPSPGPSAPGDTSTVKSNVNAEGEEANESSGGLKGGQKAGIAIGVVAAACVVGFGALVYKKRQQNIQRSQYGYAARREIL
ncbi:vegetative cell wall protein gp1-like [Diospyros lotus]|uniref:vegetative cell wall protein gp1-like n=1 Tax=Diospyros lotus TaxID=55363 RepID=UPI00224E6767|nr:vegetative cell wall protein gp1-like [Diospyros lotus]